MCELMDRINGFVDGSSLRDELPPALTVRGIRSRTFKEICCKACFIDGCIRCKLHPYFVWTGFDVFWLLIATEVAEEWALFGGAISDLQVVVRARIVPLNLQQENVCLYLTGNSSSSQASDTVRLWPQTSSPDNWLHPNTHCGCHWALLQFKLHSSLGTSQFCHYFVAILRWNPVPDYLQTAFAREVVRNRAEQLETKSFKE